MAGATRTRIAAAAAALAALGAAAVALLLRRRGRGGGKRGGDGAATAGEAGPREWTCACGQEFRVSGLGRHQVYWLAEASESDPVLSGRCPSCERPLPAD